MLAKLIFYLFPSLTQFNLRPLRETNAKGLFVLVIPFYTQGQNCPFSSWQSKVFEIYPKNSKVVPANFPSLPFIYFFGRLSHPKSAECLCCSPLCITRYGEAKTDKRRPARAVPCRSFGTPKQHGIPRHVSDRQDVSPSFAVLPTVFFHSGPAVAGANGTHPIL